MSSNQFSREGYHCLQWGLYYSNGSSSLHQCDHNSYLDPNPSKWLIEIGPSLVTRDEDSSFVLQATGSIGKKR